MQALSLIRATTTATTSSTSFCLRRAMSAKTVAGTVGIIGLGHMGGPMAKNAIKACERVVVYDKNPASVAEVVKSGGVEATSLKSFSEAHTILTMLPANPHVIEVYQNDANALFKVCKPSTRFIDSSTIAPALARQLGAQAHDLGFSFLDAPVSGGVPGATNGTLTFMLGGNDADVEKVRAFLAAMGKNLVPCGAIGNGQVAKLCNNLVLAVSMIGVAEGMSLGGRLGIDQKVLAKIFNTSTARCWSSDTYNPCPGVMENVPASRNFDGGFGVDLMLKDLGLALQAGLEVKQPLLATSLASQIYSLLSTSGLGHKDFGVVYQALQPKDKDDKKN